MSSADGRSADLLLTVDVLPGGGGRPWAVGDLAVTFACTHTCGDLLAAVGRACGFEPGGDWVMARPVTGEVFDPGELLVGTGLISGDHLVVGSTDGPAGAVTATNPGGLAIVVGSGPDTGRMLPLPRPGVFAIGRDPTADLRLTDPTVGRIDAVVTWRGGPSITVALGQGVAARVDGRPVDGAQVELAAEEWLRLGSGVVALRTVRSPAPPPPTSTGTITLQRTPDQRPPISDVVVDNVARLPGPVEPPTFPYLAALTPLVMGIALSLVYSPRFLLFVAFSPVAAAAGWLDQRRRSRAKHRGEVERFEQELEGVEQAMGEALAVERIQRRRRLPDVAALGERAAARSPDLWPADRAADDVLAVRVGVGPVEPRAVVGPAPAGEAGDAARLHRRLTPFARLDAVPVTVGLSQHRVMGVEGPDAVVDEVTAALVLHLCGHHSPDDVVLAAAISPGRTFASWLKWLPHLRSPASPLAGSPSQADDATTGDALVAAVLDRAAGRPRPAGRECLWPCVVLIVDTDLGLDPALLARAYRLDRSDGVVVVALASSAAALPKQATAILQGREVGGGEPSRLSMQGPTGWTETIVDLDRPSAEIASATARRLAPLVDAATVAGVGGLPSTIGMADVLGVTTPESAWVADRWRRRRNGRLTTTIGVTSAGPLTIDLTVDGPHCLIGGTTGAGKSELLQSLVAGLIAEHPPTSVNLLFVDYKGGATGEAFAAVPHTVGCVTNLDDTLAGRALVSLRAELDRRMRLLRGRARDLTELLAQAPEETPPALVIVIDEFATLVADVPGFMAGMIDIAQRGRSLGIHLVLATQRPAAAVNDDILANTNLRLCLRTVDGTESTSVIGRPDAASIPPTARGRGLFRSGPAEAVPFQTAWSGAPVAATSEGVGVIVRPFRRPGDATPAPTGGPGASEEPAPGGGPTTQLDRLLTAVVEVADIDRFGPARRPWLDELPVRLPLVDVLRSAAPVGGAASTDPAPGDGHAVPVAIGLVDDPAQQAQYPLIVDLADPGGLLVFGAGGSGKTTLVRTIAATTVPGTGLDPAGVGPELVVLDGGGHELTALAALPHCAAVAPGDDIEAVTRLIAALEAELRDRRAIAEANPAAAPDRRRPVVLIVDDYGALRETLEGPGAPAAHHPWAHRLARLIVDGGRLGLHAVVTADRRSAVGNAVWGALTERMVLRCADASSAADLGVSMAVARTIESLPAGRGHLRGRAVQIAVVGAPPSTPSAAHTEAVAPDVDRRRARAGDGHSQNVALQALGEAGPAGAIGHRLAPLSARVPPYPPTGRPLTVRLGAVDLERQPLEVDLGRHDMVVIGAPGSGRSTTLATVAHQLASSGAQVWACGPPLSPLLLVGGVHRRLTLPAPSAEASAWFGALAQVAESVGSSGGVGPVLVVDDVDGIDDPVLSAVTERLVRARVRLVGACGLVRGYSAEPLHQQVRRARLLVLLGPPGPLERHELAGRAVEVRPGVESCPGRAVVVQGSAGALVQVALPPAAAIAPTRSTGAAGHGRAGDAIAVRPTAPP
ncbi:MAG: FtsK/SpoIIIE domain-containing protein [Actinomycetota bacterium]